MGLRGLHHKQYHEPVVCLADPPKERNRDEAATDGLGGKWLYTIGAAHFSAEVQGC